MRFHLIDRIDEICYGRYVVGVKCITLADDVFNEHFPGYPVFPGSLILESMAQLGGSFFELTMHKEQLPLKRSVLTIVNKMKFRKPVRPGDKMLVRAEVATMQEEYGVVKVQSSIDGEVCAEGELTFSFLDIQHEALQKSRQELYDICLKEAKVIAS